MVATQEGATQILGDLWKRWWIGKLVNIWIGKLLNWQLGTWMQEIKKVFLQWFWSELDHGVGPWETQLGAEFSAMKHNPYTIIFCCGFDAAGHPWASFQVHKQKMFCRNAVCTNILQSPKSTINPISLQIFYLTAFLKIYTHSLHFCWNVGTILTSIFILKSANNSALCVSNHQGSISSPIHSIMRPAKQKFRSGLLYLYLIHFGRAFQTPSAQNAPVVTSDTVLYIL